MKTTAAQIVMLRDVRARAMEQCNEISDLAWLHGHGRWRLPFRVEIESPVSPGQYLVVERLVPDGEWTCRKLHLSTTADNGTQTSSSKLEHEGSEGDRIVASVGDKGQGL